MYADRFRPIVAVVALFAVAWFAGEAMGYELPLWGSFLAVFVLAMAVMALAWSAREEPRH